MDASLNKLRRHHLHSSSSPYYSQAWTTTTTTTTTREETGEEQAGDNENNEHEAEIPSAEVVDGFATTSTAAPSSLRTTTSLLSSSPTNTNSRRNNKPKSSFKSIRRRQHEKQDQDLLHRTLQDACQYAYGTQMVEVWVWNSTTSKLTRPEGGWWIDPYWLATDRDMTVFSQFVDTSRHDYIAPPALSPGVGVPGVLWSDLRSGMPSVTNHHGHHWGHPLRGSTHTAHRRGRSKSGIGSAGAGAGGSGSGGGTGSASGSAGGGTGTGGGRMTTSMGLFDNQFMAQIFAHDDDHYHNSNFFKDRIAWRDLKALANDPDQPYNKRLEVLATNTDLKWTGGVPFSIQGQEGIVVYYARETTNLHKLQDPTNTTYLMTASDFVGSCLALRIPRRNALTRRQREVDTNIRKIKIALQRALRRGITIQAIANGHVRGSNSTAAQHPLSTILADGSETAHSSPSQQLQVDHHVIVSLADEEGSYYHNHTCGFQSWEFIKRKVKQSSIKFWGAGNKLPPAFAWDMSMFSTIGVLVSIFCIASWNDFISTTLGSDYHVPMGPIAALLALQFGLTAAPAAQPRIILLGQISSCLTALAFAQLSLDSSSRAWIQQSLACAVSIGIMSKIGVVNPPAAANAYVFANGKYGLTNLIMALLANTIAVLCSTLLNNLTESRIYPTSWGIPTMCLSKANFQQMMETDRDDTVTALLRRSGSNIGGSLRNVLQAQQQKARKRNAASSQGRRLSSNKRRVSFFRLPGSSSFLGGGGGNGDDTTTNNNDNNNNKDNHYSGIKNNRNDDDIESSPTTTIEPEPTTLSIDPIPSIHDDDEDDDDDDCMNLEWEQLASLENELRHELAQLGIDDSTTDNNNNNKTDDNSNDDDVFVQELSRTDHPTKQTAAAAATAAATGANFNPPPTDEETGLGNYTPNDGGNSSRRHHHHEIPSGGDGVMDSVVPIADSRRTTKEEGSSFLKKEEQEVIEESSAPKPKGGRHRRTPATNMFV